MIGADLNGHVGEGNRSDEEVMGQFGFGERNEEGQSIVDFAKRSELAILNTYFKKKEEHRVTYSSGGRKTQIDYILCRRDKLQEISDCKVVLGESVTSQHRVLVCRMTLKTKWTKPAAFQRKIRWWKLKDRDTNKQFSDTVKERFGTDIPNDWDTVANVIRDTAKQVLGLTSGKGKLDKETWWWDEHLQESKK